MSRKSSKLVTRLVAGFASLSILAAGMVTGIAYAAGPTASFSVRTAGAGVSGLSTPNEIADILLGPGVQLAPSTEAKINLQTASQLTSVSPSPLPSFGAFSNGATDLGIGDGLIISANAAAASFASVSTSDRIADNRTTTVAPVPADAAALLAVAQSLTPAPSSANNVTSLTFELAPPTVAEPFLKFEYSLLITEAGVWNAGTSTWSGEVFDFPDGFALFTGGTNTTDNCAVVPGTTTYLSMETAGIVPPLDTYAAARAVAEGRLASRIADNSQPPTSPNGFAFSTGELSGGVFSENNDWVVKYLTVPLTCVYDASAEATAGVPVSVQIVIGDLNDNAVPPAAVFKANSVRWSGNDTPTQEALLSVAKSGTGSGSVSSNPAGIDCGSTCSANLALNSNVTLTATAASGSTFSGWSGACTGDGSCTVSMTEAKSVTAEFAVDPLAPTGTDTAILALAGGSLLTCGLLLVLRRRNARAR